MKAYCRVRCNKFENQHLHPISDVSTTSQQQIKRKMRYYCKCEGIVSELSFLLWGLSV